jgi:hypothetical protein
VDDLWQGGAPSPLAIRQLDRALWLYELGATDKGDALLQGWVARMPDTAPLPEGLADLPARDDLLAAIVAQHLYRGDRKALPVLQYWLDRDRLAGWMVLADLNDHLRVTSGPPIIAGLRLGPNTAKRLADGHRANRTLRQK